MKYKKFVMAVAGAACALNSWAGLQITEIMQANISSYYVDNEFPDSWVELYNNGDTSFRMVGYRLGETANFDEATPIGGGAIARGGQYIVIYCDKTGPAGNHIDMRLDSGKGELYLFNPSGEIIDHVAYKKMLGPNVSYGRVAVDSDTWGFMKTSTPGKENSPEVITQTLPYPIFSAEGYVHEGSASSRFVTLSMPTDVELPADTRLYYTTDGSEPTTASLSTTSSYRMRLTGTTVVRARLISAQAASPMTVTHSYIFHPRSMSMPVISINTDEHYFTDWEMGIFAGENCKNDWRRPINIEYFVAKDEAAVINQMGECRVHGGYTRVNPQKSLAVYTQKRFGNKRFDYPLWDAKPQVEKVKSFVLRNGGNCFVSNRIADQVGQTLFGRNVPNLDYMENTEVIAYINGKYAGIYDLRERSNEDNIESNYDGLEDIDMVENYREIKEGSMQCFNEFVNLYNSKPTLEQMDSIVDFDNFAKTVIAQAYVTNTDWPGNNMVMWRPHAEGGKWRMIMKDLDFYASNGSNSTFFNHLLRAGGHEGDTGEGNAPHSVKVFQVLWSFPEFRDLIIDYFTVNLGDFLRKNLVREHIEKMRDVLATDYEYYYHLQTYGKPVGYNSWLGQVENLIKWSESRTDNLFNYIIKDYFSLGDQVPVSVVTNESHVTFNGAVLTQPEFIGHYYVDRTMRLSTDNEHDNWRVKVTYSNGTTRTYNYTSSKFELKVTSSMTSIECEVVHTSGITDMYEGVERNISITCAHGNVCVESSSLLGMVTVTDMLGRTVASVNATGFIAELQLPERGLYVVTATNESGTVCSKKVAF